MRLSTLSSVRLPAFSVRILAGVLREHGLDAGGAFRAARLKAEDPGDSIDPWQELAFQRGFVAVTPDRPDLWFLAGSRYHVLSFAEYGLSVITSATFREAVFASTKDDLSYSLAHFRPIEVMGAVVGLAGDLSEVPADLRDFMIYRDMAAIAGGYSEIWNDRFPFTRIEVPLPPPADTAFLGWLGPVVTFDCSGLAYHWGPEMRDRKPYHSDPVLHDYYQNAWATRMPGAHPADDLINSVAKGLDQSDGAHPNLAQLARRMGYSERTLQRRLKERGLTFREVTAEARKALSIQLLNTTHAPISEIAWRLGYAEVASFTHAFRRWTGTSPHKFRLLEQSAGRYGLADPTGVPPPPGEQA